MLLAFRRSIAFAALLVAAARCECGAQEKGLKRYSRSESHMGGEFEGVLYSPTAEQAEQAFTKAFNRIESLDQALSDYDLESELSKLSDTSLLPGPPEVKLSDD